MSDGIDTEMFDGRPFGHRWSNRRIGNAPGWAGPPDPIEDPRLVTCRRHGIEHALSDHCDLCFDELLARVDATGREK